MNFEALEMNLMHIILMMPTKVSITLKTKIHNTSPIVFWFKNPINCSKILQSHDF